MCSLIVSFLKEPCPDLYCLVSPDLEDRNGALIGCNRAYLQPNPWLEEADHRERVMEEANALLERALKN